ncbi:MAG: enoyl-CoA hydratase [Burkholderiaceae bacterium]|nr:enoyl-CoA hydratase [Burkholderiaceae bacterium]
MDSNQGQLVTLRFEQRGEAGRIARVTINNERRLNTMSAALMDAFVAVFGQLANDEDLRAVVLTGAGPKAFVGGADIDEMGAIHDPAGGREFITRVHRCCDAVRRLPVPVIARIQGFTLGAGLELVASCDLRIASASARFGMPEVRLGIPSVVEAAVLPGLVGWGRTRQLLLLGEVYEAEEAARWGLVERVVADEALDAAVDEWVDALLLATPRAIRLQKALISKWEDVPLSDAVRAGIDAFGSAYETDEPARAMAAFRAERRRAKGG